MHSRIPNITSLPSFVPQMHERIPLSCISLPPHLTPSLISTKSGNLSDYSSLSSSLVSLHSTSPAGSSSSLSGSRYSLWLKLRVCPSCLLFPPSNDDGSATQQPENSGKRSESLPAAPQDSTPQTNTVCHLADGACPFAHPPANVRIENGHVTVCYDFIKRKKCKYDCCKYYHPPHYQIDEILKRGNEQRRLNGVQSRPGDFKPQSQSASPISNGGLAPTSPTTGYHQHPSVGGTGIHWQPATAHGMYSAYLSGGATPVPIPFNPASSDPTSMLLAAAIQQQQHQQRTAAAMMATPISSAGSSSAVGATAVNINGSSVGNSSTSSGSAVTTSAVPTANGVYSIPVVSESWLASKRSAHTGGDSVSDCGQTDSTSSRSFCNGSASSYPTVGGADQRRVSDSDILPTLTDHSASVSVAAAPAFSSTLAYPPGGGYCAASIPPQLAAAAAVSSLLNPINIYSLPYSTQPGIGGSPAAGGGAYLPTAAAGQYPCTPIYSAQQQQPAVLGAAAACTTADNQASLAAALTLNNFLVQQQQTSPTIPGGGLPHQPIAGAPLFANPHQMASLGVTLAALQQQQQSSTELHSSTSLPSTATVSGFHQNQQQQQQQQQQAFICTLLRAQQSQLQQQLLAAQYAATMQQVAGGPAAYAAQPPGACLIDPSFPTGINGFAALTATAASPYSMAGCYPGTLHCQQQQQNPVTNVVYINEKGNLLETLPICRDFKAGKCHRNTECRYVHLLDENVEVHHGRVTVCRDAAKGRCTRVPCKYFHVPLFAISTYRSLALNSVLTNNNSGTTSVGGVLTTPVSQSATTNTNNPTAPSL